MRRRYRHDVGVSCTVGACLECGTRWLAYDLDESRALAVAHETRAHPGQTFARAGRDAANARVVRRAAIR